MNFLLLDARKIVTLYFISSHCSKQSIFFSKIKIHITVQYKQYQTYYTKISRKKPRSRRVSQLLPFNIKKSFLPPFNFAKVECTKPVSENFLSNVFCISSYMC